MASTKMSCNVAWRKICQIDSTGVVLEQESDEDFPNGSILCLQQVINFDSKVFTVTKVTSVFRDLVTPQSTIDSLPHFTVRKRGAFSYPDCSCGICYSVYDVGDQIICLPCHHNFHLYCIESWLRWVKPSCPIDKKSILRQEIAGETSRENPESVLKSVSLQTYKHCGQEDNCLPNVEALKSPSVKKVDGLHPKKDLKSPVREVSAKNFIHVLSPFGPPRENVKSREKLDQMLSSVSRGGQKSDDNQIMSFKKRDMSKVEKVQAKNSFSKADRIRLQASVNQIRNGIRMNNALDVKKQQNFSEYEKELETLLSMKLTSYGSQGNFSLRMSEICSLRRVSRINVPTNENYRPKSISHPGIKNMMKPNSVYRKNPQILDLNSLNCHSNHPVQRTDITSNAPS